ncbi:hypothetical protein CsatB_012852 [Cannabis sativa]
MDRVSAPQLPPPQQKMSFSDHVKKRQQEKGCLSAWLFVLSCGCCCECCYCCCCH